VPAGLLSEWAACGRLDRPPHRSCYVDLPESFGRRFIVFVDTEEEFDWTGPRSRDHRATTAMRSLPALQARFRERGVAPVYLVDHPIAVDPESVAMLRSWLERGECEIGTQLHAWVNPPFEEEVNTYNSFAGNLPAALEEAKLADLTATIEAAFGRRPIVYRAGRYGVGPNSAWLLRQAGYRVDVSVRALFDYSGEGGPDFSRVEPRPFWVGDGQLLEIPLSAAFVGALRGLGPRLFPLASRLPRGEGLMSRTGLLGRVPLTPEGTTPQEAIAAVRKLLDGGVRLLSLSFHSPSAAPGHTPYVRTAADLAAFHSWWDQVLDFLGSQLVRPASVEEALAAAESARVAA
jgi:hypothetical protein